jgi:parallel beta-helix repeat protein
VISRNSIIGNTRFGVMITSGPARITLRENNFYGNGVSTDQFGVNCGLGNFTGETLSAANSYWGAATGPGAEPADVACGSPVTTTPFARSPN